MSKLLVILGITGNQGASVAETFIGNSEWKLRGITRNTTSPAARTWTSKGVDMVQGDLDDPQTLDNAFEGAYAIFSVTDYWSPLYDKATYTNLRNGQTINEYCYDREVRHGKAIAKAAAKVPSLQRFICSSLNSTKKWSGGKYTWNYHFDSKAAYTDYIKEFLPDLAQKMSILQIGQYMSNWRASSLRSPRKQPNGSFTLELPGNGDRKIPYLDTRKDTGQLVRLLLRHRPGINLLGFGSMASPKEFLDLFCKYQGVQNGGYREISMDKALSQHNDTISREVTESFASALEFGYDGGDPSVVHPKDLDPAIRLTSLEEYMKAIDFSAVL